MSPWCSFYLHDEIPQKDQQQWTRASGPEKCVCVCAPHKNKSDVLLYWDREISPADMMSQMWLQRQVNCCEFFSLTFILCETVMPCDIRVCRDSYIRVYRFLWFFMCNNTINFFFFFFRSYFRMSQVKMPSFLLKTQLTNKSRFGISGDPPTDMTGPQRRTGGHFWHYSVNVFSKQLRFVRLFFGKCFDSTL